MAMRRCDSAALPCLSKQVSVGRCDQVYGFADAPIDLGIAFKLQEVWRPKW
jgi:hypothetical protein